MRSPHTHGRRGGPLAAMPAGLARAPGDRARPDPTLAAGMLFVATACALAWIAGSLALAVYALSFWHYLLYALAYRFGAVPLATFKRDAVLTKGLALLALGSVYLAAPPDPISLAVVAAGFLLNALAAAVLGADRTYYGHEVAGLPRLRVTRFPFSVIAHPMLVGNMLAYGGTLLNDDFRAQWWPLACAHAALNLGLLLMERHVMPLRLAAGGAPRPTRAGSWWRLSALGVAGALLAGAGAWLAGSSVAPIAAALGASVTVHGYAIFVAYTTPAPASRVAPPSPLETQP